MLLVVTPTLGKSPFLDATIESVQGMGIAYEHLIVAPSEALNLLEKYSDRCRLVREPEGKCGMYAAINEGLRQGDRNWTHFTYINDDDLLMPGFRKSHSLACRISSPDVVYSRVGIIDEEGRQLGEYPISKYPVFNALFWRAGKAPVLQPGTIFARKVSDTIGIFNPNFRLAGDADYLCRAQVKALSFGYVNEIAASFRLNKGQLSADQVLFGKEMAMLLRANFGGPLNDPFRAIVRALFMGLNLKSGFQHVRRFGFRRRSGVFLN